METRDHDPVVKHRTTEEVVDAEFERRRRMDADLAAIHRTLALVVFLLGLIAVELAYLIGRGLF